MAHPAHSFVALPAVRPSTSLLVFFLSSTFLFSLIAADKNGVAPTAISVPTGPGSIEGLGESFQPSLNSGTAKYEINLLLPPGTAGHAPSLSLNYESGNGNGPLGFGWRIPLPHIQRQTDKGIPRYRDASPTANPAAISDPRLLPDSFINEAREELVPTTNNFHFSKNEGAFIRYQRTNDFWIGTLPNGTQLSFGPDSTSRIIDSQTGRVFAWLLARQTDAHGNVITYQYEPSPLPADQNQKYLARIAYGAGAPPFSSFHFVRFHYEERPDWFEDCRAGFAIRTGQRLKSIFIGTQGIDLPNHAKGDFNDDGQPDCLVRKYSLAYHPVASLLASVRWIGADNQSALPPVSFTYLQCNPDPDLSAAGREIGSLNAPPFVMDNDQVELLDLNADGLPDLLKTDFSGTPHQAFLNLGQITFTDGRRLIRWSSPAELGGDERAWNVSLLPAAQNAHLADMDGDGLADLAFKSAADDVFFFRNQGNISWGPRQVMSIEDFSPPAPFGRPEIRTADLDFDKRIDVIQSVPVGNSFAYQIWFNLGAGRYSPRLTQSPEFAFGLDHSGVQFADLNGDRVPDLARIRPDSLIVTAGFGYGQFSPPVTVPLDDASFSETQIALAKLVDITGDGLEDLVLERASPGVLWFWINLGNYSFSERKQIRGMPVSPGLRPAIRWADLNGNGTTDLVYADSSSDPPLLTIDIGELLGCAPAPNLLLTINNGLGRSTTIQYSPSTDLISEDAQAGRPWLDPLPFPVHVVTAVVTSDSLGHTYSTRFRYRDGYYDPIEKEFRGFAQALQFDLGDSSAPTLLTHSFFDTGRQFEPLKGKRTGTSVSLPDGQLFWTETNLWSRPPRLLQTGANGQPIQFAHPTLTRKRLIEAGAAQERLLESEFEFDDYGNQIRLANYGAVDSTNRSFLDDERLTLREFALNPQLWILRHPKQELITDETGRIFSRTEYFYDDETFSGLNPGLLTRGTLTLKRSWINPATANNFIPVHRARYDAFGNPVLLIDPLAQFIANQPNLTNGHFRQIDYDPAFHSFPIREIIHPGGGRPPLVSQAQYNHGFGTVLLFTNFNGHPTEYSYDPFGRLAQVVEPGDSPDLPTLQYRYAHAVSVGPGQWVNFIETRQRDRAPLNSPAPETSDDRAQYYYFTRTYSDGLGRTLLTKSEAPPAPGNTAPRVVISKASLFNARQQIRATLNPCFSIAPANSLEQLLAFENIEAPNWRAAFHIDGSLQTLDLPPAPKTSFTYDALLRQTSLCHPDGKAQRLVYAPLITRSYDENDSDPSSPSFNTPSIHYRDGLERLIQVDESIRLSPSTPGSPDASLVTIWSSYYKYNLNDQLVQISDAQDNVKTIHYDGLHRRILIDDPNAGRTSFFYDDASNLIATLNAAGQRIVYQYDGANRLLSEEFMTATRPITTTIPQVIYTYDSLDPQFTLADLPTPPISNAKGQIAAVRDLSGVELFSYDARGRLQSTAKQILSIPGYHTTLFRTEFDYDPLGRLQRLVYPDNDQVRFEYDAGTSLHLISGGPNTNLLHGLQYTPAGQLLQLHYGNGIQTSHSYDARQRLVALSTRPLLAPSNPILDLAYHFDAASNVKRILDQRPPSVVPSGHPRRNTQWFDYDDLYRLARVSYDHSLPDQSPADPATLTISFQYDRIGNLRSRLPSPAVPDLKPAQFFHGGSAGSSSRTARRQDDPPGPHALTTAMLSNQTNSILYDPKGNVVRSSNLVLTWDFKNRLIQLDNGVDRTEYIYDYADRRVLKRVIHSAASSLPATNVTVYLNRYFELRNNEEPIKYVYHGDQRVARITGSLSFNSRLQRIFLQPGWNLVSTAVDLTNAPAQLQLPDFSPITPIDQALKWDPASSTFQPLPPNRSLAAPAVLWLKAKSAWTLTLSGRYPEPSSISLSAGPQFIPSFGLQSLATESLIPSSLNAWKFNARHKLWDIQLPGLTQPNGLPNRSHPGNTFFLIASLPQDFVPDALRTRIQYFHLDHTGSTAAITDAQGQLLREFAYYPFGETRFHLQNHSEPEPYQFGQQELDTESGLHHFGNRYLAAHLARFITPDPLATHLGQLPLTHSPAHPASIRFLINPQKLNPYSYVLNNPLRYSDTSGLEESAVTTHVKEKLEQFEKDNPTLKGKAYTTSGDRTADEQTEIILDPKRADNYTNIKKRFKDKFSLKDLPKHTDLTDEQKEWWTTEIDKQAGKSPGFPHVGGKAQDVSVKNLSKEEKEKLHDLLKSDTYDILKEKVTDTDSEYGVTIDEANVLHVYEK